MAIGTTAALILGGAAVGGNIAAAKIQSNAAKNAAKTQSDAANQAMVNTRADTDRAVSYIDAARAGMRGPSRGGAYGMLSRSMGMGGGVQPGTAAPGGGPQSMMQILAQNGAKFGPGTASGNAAFAQQGGAPGAGMFAQPQFVRMRAPNGEVATIHPDRVPFYEQKGAVRL